MSYTTLLVHVGPQGANNGPLGVARKLADRFDADVIGAAACDPMQPASFEAIYGVDVVEINRSYGTERLLGAEGEFRASFAGRENRIEWRSAFAAPGPYLAKLCRAADLVLTALAPPDLLSSPNWRLDPGDLIMQAGRPVLMVPQDYAAHLAAKTIVVGWKDNRESRRAVVDALPLARLADRVLVASVTEIDDSSQAGLADVVEWFRRHGVTAEKRSEPLVSDPASQLRSLALDEDADLIVTGAYGHSRTREWILGGVTHDFLTRGSTQCLMMSH